MDSEWIVGLPVALVVFGALTAALYRLSGRWAARGKESPGKHLPYACGEDLVPEEVRLSYHGFYRLGLMFVIVHIAALMLATLSRALDARLLATAYLAGVSVCVDVLARGEN